MTILSADTSVVVVGAGQAGLSVAYYLRRLGLEPGIDFSVLDRGPAAGGAWQHRWDSLRLGSAHRVHDLPGMNDLGLSFETANKNLPARQVVADYYHRYEEHFGLNVVRPAAVTTVENQGADLLVTFSGDTHPTGEPATRHISAPIVVNATGTWGSPFLPWYPGRDSFLGRQLHTTDYVSAEDLAGQRVVVVGGGTSAIGFLLDLEPAAAKLTWVSRRPVDFLELGELNVEAGLAAVAMQDAAARAGRALPSIVSGTGVPRTRRMQAAIERGLLVRRPMFASIEPGGVRWADGSFVEADAILWATGFRPELRHLSPLGLREKEGGVSVAGGLSWRDPRIFFAGYGPQASTVGANRAGRTIARQVVVALTRIQRAARQG
ncbi:pyridine nucleotide-disulfide oxidoreductase [Glaciihabitans tibetensis]|uniref:Pyridine nucleotide-disulfide oxidoreductase n=1 Tax=Glaciihabitans tibetensis TaxID=1266600 RepID=A0A2T0VDB7_9MICO|nr:NAD(P)-binding domain-containing protein [Glaciihabitans tibetensis]PRY68156.1 pyridine nucleotide-disulfide oxidoreductase [Glaciihabitans tibetensis]